jgi:tetrahydromethanopterin S-methyltransferase subunit E
MATTKRVSDYVNTFLVNTLAGILAGFAFGVGVFFAVWLLTSLGAFLALSN